MDDGWPCAFLHGVCKSYICKHGVCKVTWSLQSYISLIFEIFYPFCCLTLEQFIGLWSFVNAAASLIVPAPLIGKKFLACLDSLNEGKWTFLFGLKAFNL